MTPTDPPSPHPAATDHPPPASHRRPRRRGLPRGDDGAQALELAALMPLLLVLALLVLAAGQVVLGALLTDRTAALAARTAAVAHDDEVHLAVQRAGEGELSIDPPSGSRRPGDPVTVTLTRRLPVLLVGDLLGGGVPVRASATFMTETVP